MSRTNERRFARPLAWLAAASLLLLALGLPGSAAASPTGAPGNNGTVKIHDEYEPDPVIKNEPHVDCPFHLHFFFADSGQTGDWWIQEWSPNDKGTLVWSGSYTTDSNGEYVTGPISLEAGHYKLFWEGDKGNRIKHKAFWVDNDCEPQAAPAPTPTPTPVPGATPAPTPTPQGGVGAIQLPNTSTVPTASTDNRTTGFVIAIVAGLLAAAYVLTRAGSRSARTRR
jgi:hypothetical protein